MLVGSLVVSHISMQWATWTAMIALLAVHLGTNYLAVRAVSMRTLNRQRANLVFSTYLEEYGGVGEGEDVQNILTPREISARERVFERDGVLRWKGGEILGYCRIGVSLRSVLDLFGKSNQATGSYQSSEAQQLLEEFEQDDYILWYDLRQRMYLIVLKTTANTVTQLHAWLHALLIAKNIDIIGRDDSILELIALTHSELKFMTTKAFDESLIQAGWDIETGALETKSGTRIKRD